MPSTPRNIRSRRGRRVRARQRTDQLIRTEGGRRRRWPRGGSSANPQLDGMWAAFVTTVSVAPAPPTRRPVAGRSPGGADRLRLGDALGGRIGDWPSVLARRPTPVSDRPSQYRRPVADRSAVERRAASAPRAGSDRVGRGRRRGTQGIGQLRGPNRAVASEPIQDPVEPFRLLTPLLPNSTRSRTTAPLEDGRRSGPGPRCSRAPRRAAGRGSAPPRIELRDRHGRPGSRDLVGELRRVDRGARLQRPDPRWRSGRVCTPSPIDSAQMPRRLAERRAPASAGRRAIPVRGRPRAQADTPSIGSDCRKGDLRVGDDSVEFSRARSSVGKQDHSWSRTAFEPRSGRRRSSDRTTRSHSAAIGRADLPPGRRWCVPALTRSQCAEDLVVGPGERSRRPVVAAIQKASDAANASVSPPPLSSRSAARVFAACQELPQPITAIRSPAGSAALSRASSAARDQARGWSLISSAISDMADRSRSPDPNPKRSTILRQLF